MPTRLSPGDKKLLWISGGFGLLLLIATGLTTSADREEASPIPSSYSPDPGGALAAYLLLSESGIPVSRSTEAPAFLSNVPADSVLILAEPVDLATSADRRVLIEFVTRGGRVLFCGEGLDAFLGLPKTESQYSALKPYQAEIPSGFTRNADTINMAPRARWASEDHSQMRLYGSEEDPVVVAAKIGQGEVLWWAAATPLTNARIADVDNLALLLNSVSSGEGRPRHVYWDEYFHGQQGSLWSYVAKTPVPWGIAQLGIVFLVTLFAFSRRSGPIVLPAVRSRLSPLEFVDTMGNLYSHAGAVSTAVSLPYRNLRLQLARKTGRSPDASDQELAAAAAQHLSLSENELSTSLRHAAEAIEKKQIRRVEALDLVRNFVGWTRELADPHRVLTSGAQEKTK